MESPGAVTPFANAEPTTTVIVTTDAAAHIIRIAIGSLDMARFHPFDHGEDTINHRRISAHARANFT